MTHANCGAGTAMHSIRKEVLVNEQSYLTISTSLGPDRARVFLEGELDLGSAPDLRRRFDELLAGNRQHRSLVVIDMHDLTFCDSSGLHVLVQVAAECERIGTTLRLTNVHANVRRVFELTGTLGRFTITSDRPARARRASVPGAPPEPHRAVTRTAE